MTFTERKGFLRVRSLRAVNLLQLCKGPLHTYQGHNGISTIDYIMIPADFLSQVKKCEIAGEDQLNCSDHFPIIMEIDIGTMLPTTAKVKPESSPRWGKVSVEDRKVLYTDLVEKNMQDILTSAGQIRSNDDIDTIIVKIVLTLIKAGRSIPPSRYRPNLKPYWSNELTDLKNIKVLKYRVWVLEGRPRGYESVSYREHKSAKKDFAHAIRRVSKEYKKRRNGRIY